MHENSIKLLNQAVSEEITALHQYMYFHFHCDDQGYDLLAGLFASWAIMAALVGRNASGQGAVLDVAMYDALFSMLTTSHALHFYAGQVPQRVGNRHPLSTPFGCFATRDGQVVIAVLSGRQFATLAALIGVGGYTLAFALSLGLDQPFGPVCALLLVMLNVSAGVKFDRM